MNKPNHIEHATGWSRRSFLRGAGAAAAAAAATVGAAPWLTSPAGAATATVTTFPVPPDVPASSDFSVTAGGQAVGTFHAGVNAWSSPVTYGTFDFEGGAVRVDITVEFEFSSYKLVPASLGITSTRSGQVISFTLDEPANVSLVLDDDYQGRTLHLFAQKADDNPADPADPDVIYFGPGYHEDLGDPIFVNNGQTLYLATGAVLRARIRIEDTTNAAIRGHGILVNDYDDPDDPRNVALAIVRSSQIVVDGIIVNRNIASWTAVASPVQGLLVHNYKAISPGFASTDGFNIINSQDVTFDNVFSRSSDDALALKGDNEGYHPLKDPAEGPAVRNVVVKNSQFWSDKRSPLQIGGETIAAEFSDITFENIDILYNAVPPPDQRVQGDMSDRAAMNVFMLNATRIEDLRYRNIRVEKARRLINLDIRNGNGSLIGNQTWGPSRIADVTFENIRSMSDGSNEIKMSGLDSEHDIRDIKLDHIEINGAYVENPSKNPELRVNSVVSDVEIRSPGGRYVLDRGPANAAPSEEWNPDKFDMERDLSPVQGYRGWRYQTWTAAGGATDMVMDRRWFGPDGRGSIWHGWSEIRMRPDNNEIWVTWTAPKPGDVELSSRVRKNFIGGGDGVLASIWSNETPLWPADGGWTHIAFDDFIGVTTEFGFTVSEGDVISFRLNQNDTVNSDTSGWRAVIMYVG